MGNYIRVGASVPTGVEYLKILKKLRLGNFVLMKLSMDKQEALEISRFCRENNIQFIFSELLWRGTTRLCWAWRKKIPRSQFYSKQDLEEICKAGGEYYLGRMTLGEVGGLLYLPKAYLFNRAAGDYRNLPVVNTVAEAKQAYIDYMKKFIAYERSLGKSRLLDVESGLVFKYHIEAGIDILCHEAMPGDPHIMHSAIRGASRAFNKRPWGVHIAMACYGGVKLDSLWMKRWKTSLYYAFITGAEFIYPECGHIDYKIDFLGVSYDFHSKEMKKSRRILREFYQFSQVHARPMNGPKVRIGFVHGNLDGAPGLWNKYVWGQFKGRKWLEGPPEWGWEYLNGLHRKEEWSNSLVQGGYDFSGNPPYGQYDIVPIESPINILKRYSCLVFLGWNTMTDEIYHKLKEYVSSGGRLVMSVPHLSTHIDRADDLKLFNNGDFSDLFGVVVTGKGKKDVGGVKCFNESSLPSYKFPKWRINADPRFMGEITLANAKLKGARVISGYSTFYTETVEKLSQRPILVENTLGRGKAFLVTVWQYPGDRGIGPFIKDVLRTVIAGEQGKIRIIASDRIRYAVYEEVPPYKDTNTKYAVIYLLNTDHDCGQLVKLWIDGKITEEFYVPANEMYLVYYRDGIVIISEDKLIDLKSWKTEKNRHEIKFYSVRDQKLGIYNLNNKRQFIEINGRETICEQGGKSSLFLKRKIDLSRKEFFELGFLSEPYIKWEDGELPY